MPVGIPELPAHQTTRAEPETPAPGRSTRFAQKPIALPQGLAARQKVAARRQVHLGEGLYPGEGVAAQRQPPPGEGLHSGEGQSMPVVFAKMPERAQVRQAPAGWQAPAHRSGSESWMPAVPCVP